MSAWKWGDRRFCISSELRPFSVSFSSQYMSNPPMSNTVLNCSWPLLVCCSMTDSVILDPGTSLPSISPRTLFWTFNFASTRRSNNLPDLNFPSSSGILECLTWISSWKSCENWVRRDFSCLEVKLTGRSYESTEELEILPYSFASPLIPGSGFGGNFSDMIGLPSRSGSSTFGV